MDEYWNKPDFKPTDENSILLQRGIDLGECNAVEAKVTADRLIELLTMHPDVSNAWRGHLSDIIEYDNDLFVVGYFVTALQSTAERTAQRA